MAREMTSERSVTVALPRDARRPQYALDLLLGLLGVRARVGAPGEQADLAYGGRRGRLRIPRAEADWDHTRPNLTWNGGVPIVHPPDIAVRASAAADELGFDILYATYAFATAPWERDDPTDEVACPLAAGGWPARNGVLLEPVVHRYAALLGERLGIAARPRPPVVVLTHDVDSNFAHLFERRESWTLLEHDARRVRPAALRRAAGLARRVVRRRGADPNDRFDHWARRHRELGSRPAYFVASHGLFRPQAHRRDVPYDVRHPEVRAVLRRAVAAGAEIGVHFSIPAQESSERLRAEREALEEAIDGPVRSARHHWWALGRPEQTWRRHADAGIEVDCSLGYNDGVGFRRGLAVPFRPFDPVRQQAAGVWVLPTIAMDAAVAGRGEQALAEFRTACEETLEAGGALVLDWHVHAANPCALPGALDRLTIFADEVLADGAAPKTPLELLEA
jgi:hypothetical protein